MAWLFPPNVEGNYSCRTREELFLETSKTDTRKKQSWSMSTLSQDESLVQCHDIDYHGKLATKCKSLAVLLFALKKSRTRNWGSTLVQLGNAAPWNVLSTFILLTSFYAIGASLHHPYYYNSPTTEGVRAIPKLTIGILRICILLPLLKHNHV